MYLYCGWCPVLGTASTAPHRSYSVKRDTNVLDAAHLVCVCVWLVRGGAACVGVSWYYLVQSLSWVIQWIVLWLPLLVWV